MNYSTIHELPVLTPSFSIAVLGETEVSLGNYKTGQVNLFSAIGTALAETFSSGYLQEVKSAKFFTAFGSSDDWTRASTFVLQNTGTLVTKDYLQNNYLSLTGGTIQAGLIHFGDIRANQVYVEDGFSSNDWNQTTTLVKEFSSIKVFEHNNNLVFTNNHHGRAHHFNTPTGGTLTVTVPVSVSDGFNVIIMNTGQGVLQIESTNLLSTGTTIETRYSGAFIYKDNNIIYAVGNIV